MLFAGWQLILGGIGLVVISLLSGERDIQWSWRFTFVLVILGVFSTAIVTCAWFWLLQKEKAGTLEIYLFIEI